MYCETRLAYLLTILYINRPLRNVKKTNVHGVLSYSVVSTILFTGGPGYLLTRQLPTTVPIQLEEGLKVKYQQGVGYIRDIYIYMYVCPQNACRYIQHIYIYRQIVWPGHENSILYGYIILLLLHVDIGVHAQSACIHEMRVRMRMRQVASYIVQVASQVGIYVGIYIGMFT